MAKIREEAAVSAYKAIHSLQQEKKEITKEQKEHKDLVKAYLEENPEGFYVLLEDARGNVHDHHIFKNHTERVSLDKDSLRAKLLLKFKESGEAYHVPKTMTSAYLARMVEQGYLTADEIEGYEDIQESSSIKKQKLKGGRPQPVTVAPVKEGIKLEAGEQMTLNHGIENSTLTVKRGDGTTEIHRPQVSKRNPETGEMEVVQDASVEKLPPSDEPPRTWKV